MILDQINSKKQGDVGVGMAIAYFTSLGWIVSIPLSDNQEYDLIVDVDCEFKKVQIKTTNYLGKSGNYETQLRSTMSNLTKYVVKHFDHKKVDFLFILAGNKDMYFIPTQNISNRSGLSLGKKYEKYKVLFGGSIQ